MTTKPGRTSKPLPTTQEQLREIVLREVGRKMVKMQRHIDKVEKTSGEWKLRAKVATHTIRNLRLAVDDKQARIDRLMLEHCPEEMSRTQLERWKDRQEVAAEQAYNSGDRREHHQGE